MKDATRALMGGAVILALLSGPALAMGGGAMGGKSAERHGAGQGPRMSFDMLDANGDGVLSGSELTAPREARFAATDTDGDGSLSRAEIDAMAGQIAAAQVDRMIARHDSNGDGAISRAEMQDAGEGRGARRAERMLSRLDTDGDGRISRAEFDARMARPAR